MRYYISQSSGFSYGKRQILGLQAAVKRGGGKNVRDSRQFGWSNQPLVVTFTATPPMLKKIETEIEKVAGTKWIIIHKKDW